MAQLNSFIKRNPANDPEFNRPQKLKSVKKLKVDGNLKAQQTSHYSQHHINSKKLFYEKFYDNEIYNSKNQSKQGDELNDSITILSNGLGSSESQMVYEAHNKFNKKKQHRETLSVQRFDINKYTNGSSKIWFKDSPEEDKKKYQESAFTPVAQIDNFMVNNYQLKSDVEATKPIVYEQKTMNGNFQSILPTIPKQGSNPMVYATKNPNA